MLYMDDDPACLPTGNAAWPDAQRILQRCLGEQRDALDGYPVAALLQPCLAADDPAAPQRHDAALLHEALTRWLALVDDEIATFPPTSTAALATQRRQLVATQQALAELLRRLAPLGAAAS